MPEVHTVHDDAPGSATLPGLHGLQVVEAGTDDVPAAHGRHVCVVESAYEPAAHGVHCVALAGEMLPGGHSSHDVEPFCDAFVPAGQPWQTWLVMLAKVPGWQMSQLALPADETLPTAQP